MVCQVRWRAMSIEQRQIGDINFFHTVDTKQELARAACGCFESDASAILRSDYCENWAQKKGRPDLAPLFDQY
jgi:hypothetical protein